MTLELYKVIRKDFLRLVRVKKKEIERMKLKKVNEFVITNEEQNLKGMELFIEAADQVAIEYHTQAKEVDMLKKALKLKTLNEILRI